MSALFSLVNTRTPVYVTLFAILTFVQVPDARGQTTPLFAPEIQELRFEGDSLVIESTTPAGFRYALLEIYHPGVGAYWEPLVAGPLTGAASSTTFTVPDPGNRAMVRVRTGDDKTVPASTLSGELYFSANYGTGGTYIDSDAEILQTLNRLSYGATAASYSEIQTVGTAAYIAGQLAPETIDESGNTALNSRTAELFLEYIPGTGEPLLEVGAPITYFKGTVEPPATWMAAAFDDTGWLTGTSGVGYDAGGGDIYNTDLADMQGNYSTVYVRHDFTVADTSAVENLILDLDFDDAFIAYLNGTEIARFNITGTLPPFNTVSGSTGGFENSGDPSTFDITANKSLLINGTNVLAIQLINASLAGSSDAALVPELRNFGSLPYNAISSIRNLQHLIHLRGVYSEKQLQATLAAFWENHFTTDYDKVRDYIINLDEFDLLPAAEARFQASFEAATIEYEEYEFLYQNALGNFGDLLLYSATSPSMLIYLDSIVNRKNAPNENYAREILELSAFGVDNRYEQADIEELARSFTGWSVRKVHPTLRKPFPQSARDPFTTGSISVANETAVLPIGATWSYFKGLTEPPADWMSTTFDASGWATGPTGIGHGDGDDATLLDDMRLTATNTPGYMSFFARSTFSIDPGAYDDAVISIDYDDAYVAYLNGTEIARSSSMGGTVGTPPTFDQAADFSHSAVTDGGSPDIIDLANHSALLLPSPQLNTLAIQLHNVALTSSDTTLRPEVLGRTLSADSINPADPNGVWTFWFNPDQHDLDEKIIFPGTAYETIIAARDPADAADAIDDTVGIIDSFVGHPSTSEFVCVKLVNKFVSDEISLDTYHDRSAPGWLLAMVDDAIAAWNSTSPAGNIKTVMTSILDPQDKVSGFWLEGAHMSKIKDPVEFINSSFRALGADINSRNLPVRSAGMGMLLFQRDDPDGFSEAGIAWSDTLGLLERIKLSQGLANNMGYSYGAWDISAFLTEFTLLSPEDVIDHFDQIVFNSQLGTVRRSVFIDFANTDDTGASSPFTGLTTNQQATRLRDLAALILASPEFQFQ